MAIGITIGSSLTPQNPTFGTTTVTYTNCNGGTAFPAGSLVLCWIAWFKGNVQNLATCTIGGQTSTFICGDPTTMSAAPVDNPNIALLYATMPGSSQTDTVVITTGDSTNGWNSTSVSCACVILTGAAASPTASSTLQNSASGTDPQTPGAAINLPSGGVGFAGVFCESTASPAVAAWSTTGNSQITAGAGDINETLATHNVSLSIAHSITTNAAWRPQVSGTPAMNYSTSMACVTWAAGAVAATTPTRTLLGVGT